MGPPASRTVRESYGVTDRAGLRQLQRAFVQQRVVLAEYAKADGAPLLRRIEPHAMSVNWPAWYLLGYDHLRGAPRTFRFDRFRDVALEDQEFRPRPHDIAMAVLNHEGVVLAQPV